MYWHFLILHIVIQGWLPSDILHSSPVGQLTEKSLYSWIIRIIGIWLTPLNLEDWLFACYILHDQKIIFNTCIHLYTCTVFVTLFQFWIVMEKIWLYIKILFFCDINVPTNRKLGMLCCYSKIKIYYYENLLVRNTHTEIFATRLDESWAHHFQLGLTIFFFKFLIFKMMGLTKIFINFFWTRQNTLLEVHCIPVQCTYMPKCTHMPNTKIHMLLKMNYIFYLNAQNTMKTENSMLFEITTVCSNFRNSNSQNKLIWLFNSENIELLKTLCKFSLKHLP